MSAIRLILHGKGSQKKGVHAAVAAIRKAGRTVEVRVTFEAGDGAHFAREAVEDARNGKVATIVAGGGDGTINEVFGAALEADPPAACSFAVMPLGTANDFARSVGVPPDDPLAALTIAAGGDVRPIDVGMFDGRPFFNMVTGGFGSRVTVETDPEFKRRLGGLAYILTGITRFRDLSSSQGRFRAEGFEWEGSFIAIAIGNGRQAGGGIPLCPDAILDDGLLELTIVTEPGSDERRTTLMDYLRPGTLGVPEGLMKTARSSWIEFEGKEPLFVNLDGEPVTTSKFRVECAPQRLRLHVGPEAPGFVATT
jgi:lipid kinase YegS